LEDQIPVKKSKEKTTTEEPNEINQETKLNCLKRLEYNYNIFKKREKSTIGVRSHLEFIGISLSDIETVDEAVLKEIYDLTESYSKSVTQILSTHKGIKWNSQM